MKSRWLTGNWLGGAVLFLTVSIGLGTGTQTMASVTTVDPMETLYLPDGDYSAEARASNSGGQVFAPMVSGGDAHYASMKRQTLNAVEAEAATAIRPKRKPAPAKDESGGPLYPSTNCLTNVATGSAPSDIHGTAGPSRLITVTNVDIGIYTTSCTIVSRVSLKSFFNVSSAQETLFDPRVIWDQQAGRFFVTVESRNSGNTDQKQYFAVSTNNAALSWHRYTLVLSQGATRFCKRAAANFWDYPNVGKSSKRWFITANDFAGNTPAGALLIIDKAPSLNGQSVSIACKQNLPSNIAPPIVLDSSPASIFLSTGGTTTVLKKYRHTAGANPGADQFVVQPSYNIQDFAVPPEAVQPGGQKLDSLDARFQSGSIQSRNRIWNIHTVKSGNRPLIKWYRLNTANTQVLAQVLFSSSASSHLFNPSFTTNSGIDGSPAFINASRTDPTCSSTNCRAAIITFSGPNTNGTGWFQSLAATSSTNFANCNSLPRGSCRWGDYSSIVVDPNSAGVAWAFNQLINGTSQFNWRTRGVKEVYNLQE